MPKDDSIYILVACGTVLAGRGFGDRCSVHLLFKASVAEKGNWTLDRVCHDYPELSTLNSAFIDTGYLGDKSSTWPCQNKHNIITTSQTWNGKADPGAIKTCNLALEVRSPGWSGWGIAWDEVNLQSSSEVLIPVMLCLLHALQFRISEPNEGVGVWLQSRYSSMKLSTFAVSLFQHDWNILEQNAVQHRVVAMRM